MQHMLSEGGFTEEVAETPSELSRLPANTGVPPLDTASQQTMKIKKIKQKKRSD